MVAISSSPAIHLESEIAEESHGIGLSEDSARNVGGRVGAVILDELVRDKPRSVSARVCCKPRCVIDVSA